MGLHATAESIIGHLKQVSDSSSNPNITVLPIPSSLIDATFSSTTNLTTTVLNASVVSCSDDYFASASNLLTPGPPIRKAGYYVHTGAWFDGWESRRHNRQEYDWVVIKLGVVGKILGVEVDTAYFNGNEAPEAGLDGVCLTDGEDDEQIGKPEYAGWKEILPRQKCGPSQRQGWRLGGNDVHGKPWTHLKLKMYPDGGIARLRVYGSVVSPPLAKALSEGEEKPVEDLASALNGGVAVTCSDQHFGVKSNLLLPGRGKDMGDGWETARSRSPDHVDWVIIRLGLKGRVIEKIIVDTKDFRGNFPQAVKVEGWRADDAKAALETESDPKPDAEGWVEVVKGQKECEADKEHIFEGAELAGDLRLQSQVWTHIKMTMIPDGGVKRLRVFGRRA